MYQIFIVIFTISGILFEPSAATNTGLDASEIGKIYLDKLLDTISGPNKSSVSVEKLDQYFVKHAIHTTDYTNLTKCIVQNATTGTVRLDEECMLNSVSRINFNYFLYSIHYFQIIINYNFFF